MNYQSIFTQARKLGDDGTFIITVQDLDPAGVLVRAYNQETSIEYTLQVREHELKLALVNRDPVSLGRLAESIELLTDGDRKFIQSTLKGIPKPKRVVTTDNVQKFISEIKVGDNDTLPGVLTKGLAELCKVKPSGLDAVRWLGNWLLENNPNQPRVNEPGSGSGTNSGGYSVEEPEA